MNTFMATGSQLEASSYGPERRSDHRYEIGAAFEYNLAPRQNAIAVGRGHVLNISRSGVLAKFLERIPSNAAIELFIEWPVLRNHVVPIYMWIFGRTIRTQDDCTAVKILLYEFPAQK
jgi:hypothetical protein